MDHQLGILRTPPRSPPALSLALAWEAKRSSEFSICPLLLLLLLVLFGGGEKNLQQSVLLQELFLLRSSVQMTESLKLHGCQMLTPANQKVKKEAGQTSEKDGDDKMLKLFHPRCGLAQAEPYCLAAT